MKMKRIKRKDNSIQFEYLSYNDFENMNYDLPYLESKYDVEKIMQNNYDNNFHISFCYDVFKRYVLIEPEELLLFDVTKSGYEGISYAEESDVGGIDSIYEYIEEPINIKSSRLIITKETDGNDNLKLVNYIYSVSNNESFISTFEPATTGIGIVINTKLGENVFNNINIANFELNYKQVLIELIKVWNKFNNIETYNLIQIDKRLKYECDDCHMKKYEYISKIII